jgi:hypothetical protein
VRASYEYVADGDNAADTWIVYLRTNGTDPDPAIDTPTYTQTMGKFDGVARLELFDGSFAEGADVRVIVRARRSGTPNVDSTNVDVYSVTTTFIGPDAVSGGALYGGVDAQA